MSLSRAIRMPLATVACLCVYLTLANPVFAEESSHATAAVAQKYGEIALAFEPNRGQAPEDVRFLSRAKAITVLAGEQYLALIAGPSGPDRASSIQMKFPGASFLNPPVALQPQEGISNYLLGDDPAAWHTNVPNFGRVHYTGVYPGIDLVLYGNHRQLEHDFVVAPGADYRRIHVRLEGARDLVLNERGALTVQTAYGHFTVPALTSAVYKTSSISSPLILESPLAQLVTRIPFWERISPMKQFFTNLRQTAIAGFFFLFPLYVVVILISKAWTSLTSVGSKLASMFGVKTVLGVGGATLFSTLFIIAIWLLCGLLVRVSFVGALSRTLERTISSLIPGYASYRATAEEKIAHKAKILPYASAFLKQGECQQPAFVVDKDNDGNFVLFLPDIPETSHGQVLIARADKVRLAPSLTANELDACLKKMGKGLSEYAISGEAAES